MLSNLLIPYDLCVGVPLRPFASILRDCVIFGNIRVTFIWSSSDRSADVPVVGGCVVVEAGDARQYWAALLRPAPSLGPQSPASLRRALLSALPRPETISRHRAAVDICGPVPGTQASEGQERIFKNFMINERELLQRLFWYQQKKAINYFLQASWSRQCCYGCLTSHKRMTPLLQNSSTDFTKVSLILLECKIFLLSIVRIIFIKRWSLASTRTATTAAAGRARAAPANPAPTL